METSEETQEEWSRWRLLREGIWWRIRHPGYLFWEIVNGTTGTEMAEGGWSTMPHCCDQGVCWMHTPNSGSWCACSCTWCRLARRLKRGKATLHMRFDHWRDVPGQWADGIRR